MMDNKFFEYADKSRPDVAAKICRNERVAREMIALATKRHRRKPPEIAFEDVLNTLGIACAEMVRDCHDMLGKNFADCAAEMFKAHINSAIDNLGREK